MIKTRWVCDVVEVLYAGSNPQQFNIIFPDGRSRAAYLEQLTVLGPAIK